MKLSRSYKFIIYIVLWAGYFLLQYYFLSFPFDADAALVLSTRVVMIHAILFYVNSYLLLPQLLDKNRYPGYFLSVVALLILTYFLFAFSNELGIIREAYESGRFRRPRNVINFERAFRTRIFINNLISSLAVLFLSTTYWIIRRAEQRRRHEVDLMNENLQTEMKFLKSQVNPHFLLNALNNIYSFASIRSPKTPEMVLRLADMLKYVLYGSNKKQVNLGNEIKYIEDYIAFQKIKYENEPAIRTDFSKADPDQSLAPMLLIPFIENSFKHSNLDEAEGFIELIITTTENKLILDLKNSVSKNRQEKDKTGGIGLQNVQRRLNLLYPDRHRLLIKEEDDVFMIHLTLKTI